ncbi:F-box At2g26850-like isoform X1 [Olea europaea subsp. europaea]|uniref:F-box At2g26850-like isoform X1 n=1 Tax=Olea europaea subsp. europaea TaxID=158383 RepID=A0A8S0VNU5_OLEEU|nr:F-box At2g26850-like isoform X1 [Olea europaea subsp. europaea]
MLYFLIYCLSFLLLSKSFFMPVKNENGKVYKFFLPWYKHRRVFVSIFQESRILTAIKRIKSSRMENLDEKQEITLLDLPDLDLECILEKLSPAGLCSMAGVCKTLREKCKSDHLWKKHMNQKWGRLIGDAVYTEWQCKIDSRVIGDSAMQKSPFQWFSRFLDDLFPNGSKMEEGDSKSRSSKHENSIMSCYMALETGKIWFPAQVYNREVQNGHIGFMLSCYDAEVCYDSKADNFVASYSAQGRRTIEENIEWNRLRAPAVDTPANVLHISDCLGDLKPDDHFEIQWRKKKEFPFGWWYGVVGHLGLCNGHEVNCMCHMSDMVILEFKQYIPGSQWRRTAIKRKDHREGGNEGDGFYGGIRKLYNKEEIEAWKNFWTNSILE